MCMVEGSDFPNRCSLQVTRRAAKDHKCHECGRTIAKGERYQYMSGIDYDGNAFSHKMCAHCGVAADWLSTNCGGYLLHAVEEDIREHVEEYPRMDLARLAVGMRKNWQRIRGDGLMPIPALPRPIALGDARA